MSKATHITLALLAATVPVAAQAQVHQENEDWRRSGAGYFMLGTRQLESGGTNQMLGQAGFAAIGSNATTIGGGGHFTFGRFIIGGEGAGIITSGGENTLGTGQADVRGGYGMLRLGWAVVSTPYFNLYPLVGVGGGGLGLKVSAGTGLALGDGGKDEVGTGGVLTEVGLGLDARIPLVRKLDHQGFMLVGLRAGYTYAPIPGQWKIEAAGQKHALAMEGVSLRLVVGFGGYAVKP